MVTFLEMEILKRMEGLIEILENDNKKIRKLNKKLKKLEKRVASLEYTKKVEYALRAEELAKTSGFNHEADGRERYIDKNGRIWEKNNSPVKFFGHIKTNFKKD